MASDTASVTCGFIGLGLIGGSIARAIREKLPSSRIIAFDVSQDTLTAARDAGIADAVTASIDSGFSSCDYLFLCAPVQKNDENLRAVKAVISPDCLLTDVGSVKGSIHRAIREAGLERQFIGGHPMAGSERTGFLNSKALLLENVYYILTPTQEVPADKIRAFQELVQTLGAIPLVLTPEQQDYVTAAVSHLPHVIAASLVNLVRNRDSQDGVMKMIAAGGFKDITRIASSSPAMWQQICLTNAENISSLLSDYIDSLTEIKSFLDTGNGDALYGLFDTARTYRDSFTDAPSGPIKKSYSVNIDIMDRAGSISSVVDLLARNNISIKNIGVSHNREFESGTLHIEFYGEEPARKACALLAQHQYPFHQP